MKKNKFKGKKQVMKRNRAIEEGYNLKELHQLFITSKKAEGLRERTIADHILHFKFFMDWLNISDNEVNTVNDLNVLILRSYVAFMQDKGLSPVTINVRLRTLRCFCKFIFDEGFVDTNFATKLKLMKTDKDTLKILTDEQIDRLLKVIDKRKYTGFRDYVAIVVMIDTGIRISELAAISHIMIDFDSMVINLPAPVTKNRSARTLPLSVKVNKYLYQLVRENNSTFNVDEVFLSVYGTPFQSKSFRKRLNHYKNKAGIEGVRVSPHSFRHYFAKNYILNGGDAFTLQRILGHSDMQIVRRYIQMNDSDVKIQHNQFSPVQRLKL